MTAKRNVAVLQLKPAITPLCATRKLEEDARDRGKSSKKRRESGKRGTRLLACWLVRRVLSIVELLLRRFATPIDLDGDLGQMSFGTGQKKAISDELSIKTVVTVVF